MKLTKRGKQTRAILLLLALLATGKGVDYLLTHHTTNTVCKQSDVGLMCDYVWIHN